MNERKLRIFSEVARCLNMTEAAKRLFISQSAVSQVILELERDLSVKLFERIGKKLFLTNEGRLFFDYINRVLNIYDEAVRVVRESNDLVSGMLRVGASTTIGIYLLPELVGSFLKEFPGINISIAVENTKLIVEKILSNELDFALVEGPVHSIELNVLDFCTDELVFIVHPNHPWTKQSCVYLDEVSRENLIMRELGSGTREVFEQVLYSQNLNYNITLEFGNTEAIKKAVEARLGVACVSKRCIRTEEQLKKLSVIRLCDKLIERQFRLVYHKDKFQSKLFQTFIKFAYDFVQTQ